MSSQSASHPTNDGGGAAALALALSYHGVNVALEALQKDVLLPDGTTTARKITEAARAHGLKAARGARVERKEQLVHVPTGSIIHRRDNRFQVVKQIAADSVTVVDPFQGEQTLSVDSFWSAFSGVAILLK